MARLDSTHAYRIHLEPEEEGGYTVTVPALPGCVTWGQDVEHALAMAKEVIEGFLEVLAKHGQPIPPSDATPPSPLDLLVEVPHRIAV